MMSWIEKGLAYIGVWLVYSSIVLDATNPQNSVSELSSQNNSATRTQGSSENIGRLLEFGDSSDSQDQHRFVGIHLGSGDIIQQYGSTEEEKKETDLSEISRSARIIEEQGNKIAAVVDGLKVGSSNFIDRLEELTNRSIATTQDLRSSFDQMSARIASIDRSLAGIAELTNETLIRSEQILSACNSTRTQSNETEPSLCSYSSSGPEWLLSDCWKIYQSGCYESGIYKIRPLVSSVPFSVYCEMDAYGGGWTVFQNRTDGSLSFYQKWYRYKDGFGSLDGEFWLGLERLHQLTNSKRYELLVELEDFDGETRFAVYDNFVVSSEEEKYSLQELGNYTGSAGDSLSRHVGFNFSTWDRDNDRSSAENCAMSHGGGWWMGSCGSTTLNGHYLGGQFTQGYLRAGIEWDAWRGDAYSYKKSRMSMRPLYL